MSVIFGNFVMISTRCTKYKVTKYKVTKYKVQN